MKKSFSDTVQDATIKLSKPLGKIASIPCISAIQEGLVTITPVIIIGSIFLILGIMGQPWIGDSGEPLVKFLVPYSEKFLLLNDMTMGFISLYAAICIAMSYSEKLKLNSKTGAVLGLATFLLININFINEGQIAVRYFSAAGLFVAIISSVISVKLYKWLVDKKLTIRLPDSVPPNVGNAFSALIPFLIIFTIAWTIRTLLGFDLAGWFEKLLLPFFNAADNIFMFTTKMTLDFSLWSVGLHGGNMLAPIFSPFVAMWTAENAAAVAAGNVPTHIWAGSMDRMTGWVSTVWPLLFLLYKSKVKHHKVFAIACIPAAIFGIVEPVIFGLPLALNPFLFIPFIFTTIVTSALTYFAFQIGLVAKFFVELPWATPAFILGPLGTGGDFRTLILIAVNFIVGLIIFYPFFKIYEQHELENEKVDKAMVEIEN